MNTQPSTNPATTNHQQPTNPTTNQSNYTHPSSYVDEGAVVGAGTKIWHFSHIMKGAVIGERCSFGQNVNVADGVTIGNNVKVQNNVSIYAGTVIEDDVFLGPSCVLTNVTNPRSQVSRQSLYEQTVIRRGASLGANCTIVCGVTIGRYALIGAGAVVTKDVPDYALMVGNPARQKGWISRHGHSLSSCSLVVDSLSSEQPQTTNNQRPTINDQLIQPPTKNHKPSTTPTTNHQQPTILTCPESGLRYQLVSSPQPQTTNNQLSTNLTTNPQPPTNPTTNQQPPTTNHSNYQLKCLDLDEEAPLPLNLTKGTKSYDEFKK